MEVNFAPEIEEKLAKSAAEQGRNPSELVAEVVMQHFAQASDHERRFLDAETRGEAALERGEYLSHDQVGQSLERFLRI